MEDEGTVSFHFDVPSSTSHHRLSFPCNVQVLLRIVLLQRTSTIFLDTALIAWHK